MKRLLLLRHGKSDWGDKDLDDFDRPLSGRGREASRRIAEWLAARSLAPERVLISSALRARETWEQMSGTLGRAAEPDFRQDLYLASPDVLLAHIEALPDGIGSAMVIAHNPGLEALARMLAGPDPDADAMRDLMRGYPTAGLAVHALSGDRWNALSGGGARLDAFVRPRELGGPAEPRSGPTSRRRPARE